ncbi:hypothetical protein KGM_208673 [Danaus plexippus plexippus]|uniref:Uncharacterized protein n=1 Tax=Danaus plexippus plexippus TaxID=278856 RepID=A0A212EM54_DANPL|nr:hypothetical protein KGM_208673 [Danaus plexippus plexippus]
MPRCPSVDFKASDTRPELRVDICSIQPAMDQFLSVTGKKFHVVSIVVPNAL